MLLRALVIAGLAMNLGLLLGGIIFARVGAAHRSSVSPGTMASLRQQQITLEEQLRSIKGLSAAEAESRSIGLFSLAEGLQVQVWSLTNDNRRERFGRQDLQVFATFLELRGRRERVLALLQKIPVAFGDNALFTNVDARGTPEAWSVRLSVSQVIRA